MNTFDNFFKSIINESIIDIPRNSLDPTVFEFPDNGFPIMHPIIKTQIMSDIEKFKEIVPVVVYFVVGSILTRTYSSHSDIDVNVQIDPSGEGVIDQVYSLVKSLNGKLAAGTTHPINYFVIKDDYDLDKTNAAYDVANEEWIKEPEQLDLDVNKYMDNFQSTINGMDLTTNELRRNIIDYDSLKEMGPDQIDNLKTLMQSKLEEIEGNIETLTRTYKNVRDLRKNAFEKEMTPTEIRLYGKKNRLPENVVYKMLERYYYFDFIKQLKKLIEDDKITSNDVKKIKKAGQEFWK